MYFLPAPFKLTTEKSANHFILVLSERKEKLTIEKLVPNNNSYKTNSFKQKRLYYNNN